MGWVLCLILSVAVLVAVELGGRRRRARIASHVAALDVAAARVQRAAAQRAEMRRRARERRPRHSKPPYPVVR